MIYHENEHGTLYCGDCLDIMRTLPDNSVDAVVTDPPYGLSFMGKKWDCAVQSVEIWAECLRVLKPGGYLLSFAGTRTQHRIACGIEDAGFEIRDMIAWVYGSGFPKSLNIGKAVDKLQGNDREITGMKRCGIADSPFGSVEESRKHIPETKGTSEWEGWGTALKPALEPITVARKPLQEKTVAENCLKWGVGGINIDGSRVGNEEIRVHTDPAIYSMTPHKSNLDYRNHHGRFPANLIHDGSDEVLECFPNDAARFFYCAKASKAERNAGLEDMQPVRESDRVRDDGVGGDNPRNRSNTAKQNHHPTVKPIALMEYLIKLVAREGYTVLDPFLGSGTTAIACVKQGRRYIGCEMDKDYCEIAARRIERELDQTTIDL